jgi:hypothetical protein
LASCHDNNQGKKHLKYEEYVIQVDSFSAPDSLKLNQKVQLTFWGTVGPDNSYKFDRFLIKQDSIVTQIMLIGRRELHPKKVDSTVVLLRDCSYGLMVEDSLHTRLEILNPGHQQKLEKQFVLY